MCIMNKQSYKKIIHNKYWSTPACCYTPRCLQLTTSQFSLLKNGQKFLSVYVVKTIRRTNERVKYAGKWYVFLLYKITQNIKDGFLLRAVLYDSSAWMDIENCFYKGKCSKKQCMLIYYSEQPIWLIPNRFVMRFKNEDINNGPA